MFYKYIHICHRSATNLRCGHVMCSWVLVGGTPMWSIENKGIDIWGICSTIPPHGNQRGQGLGNIPATFVTASRFNVPSRQHGPLFHFPLIPWVTSTNWLMTCWIYIYIYYIYTVYTKNSILYKFFSTPIEVWKRNQGQQLWDVSPHWPCLVKDTNGWLPDKFRARLHCVSLGCQCLKPHS